MNFAYTGSGVMTLFGCASPTITCAYTSRFAVRSVVYLCCKAQVGIMEAVAIKRINFVRQGASATNCGQATPMYIDTYNQLYMENELCTQADALTSAKAYWQNKLNQVNAKLGICQQ